LAGALWALPEVFRSKAAQPITARAASKEFQSAIGQLRSIHIIISFETHLASRSKIIPLTFTARRMRILQKKIRPGGFHAAL